jgi:hypothetical protein
LRAQKSKNYYNCDINVIYGVELWKAKFQVMGKYWYLLFNLWSM